MMKELDRGYQADYREKTAVLATDEAPSATPIEEARYVLRRATDLAHRVQALADKLLGPIPTRADGTQGASPASGILDGLSRHAREVDTDIGEANGALNRIESALP